MRKLQIAAVAGAVLWVWLASPVAAAEEAADRRGVSPRTSASDVDPGQATAPSTPQSSDGRGETPRLLARNVIVMIMDGAGSSHVTLARWYKGSPLALDSILVGGIKTYCANSVITDSAPAGTAYATGHKSSDGLIGITADRTTIPGLPVLPEAMRGRPVASVLEAARLSGRSVGLVATANVQHATPASFSAHWHDRDDYVRIALQQVHAGLDVVIGGGRKYLLPRERQGVRRDGLDLTAVLERRGYQIASNRQEMDKLTGRRAWCMLAEDHMFCDLDRRELKSDQPSLREMTAKAISLLDRNPQGFFLMVESSKIDWAAHANDPVGVVSDLLAFDEAVAEALRFARADGRTLVLAMGDHGCGGLTIGRRIPPEEMLTTDYAATDLDRLLKPLKRANRTAEGVEIALLGDYSPQNIRRTIETHWGIDDLDDDEMTDLGRVRRTKMNNVLGPIFSKRTFLGWTSNGHTGEDLFLYAFGPGKPSGLIENTQVARACAAAMGADLEQATRELFVPWSQVAAQAGLEAEARLEPDLFPTRLVAGDDKLSVVLHLHTDRMTVNGQEHRLGGLAVEARINGEVYLPRSAVAILKAVARTGPRPVPAEKRGHSAVPILVPR